MLKTFLFIFLTLSFISCGKSGGGGGSSSSNGDAISVEEIATNLPVPQAALNFEVSVKLVNFNSAQEDKVLMASDLITTIKNF